MAANTDEEISKHVSKLCINTFGPKYEICIK